VIGDPFSFTSPYDDHIDRTTYFKRCWGNAERIKAHRIEKLFAQGDEALALYEAELVSGEKFRNTEFFRVKDGKLAAVEVISAKCRDTRRRSSGVAHHLRGLPQRKGPDRGHR
jgi:hypothetical protein